MTDQKSGAHNFASISAYFEPMRLHLAEGMDLIIGRWAVWIACAVAGGVCSAAAYAAFKSAPASYPEFIVGAITMVGVGKARDYAMLFAFMFGFVALFTVLGLAFRRLSLSTNAAIVDDLCKRFILAALPVLAWCGTFLLARTHTASLFWCSASFVGALTWALCLVARRPEKWTGEGASIMAALDGTAMLPLLGVLAVLAVSMAGNRVAILDGPALIKVPNSLYLAAWVAAALGLGLGAAVVTRAPTAKSAAILRNLVILFQALLPGLFLAVLPIPIGPVDRHYSYADPIEPGVWIFLGALALLTWADLARLWRKGVRESLTPPEAVSALSLIAVLIYCRAPVAAALGAPFDDYHFGEDFIPWWSWVKHGLIPLWDFTPPRGLINYKWGLVAWAFGAQDAGQMMAMKPYLFAVTLLLVFFPLAALVGKWRAFLFLAFAAMEERLGDIDVLMTAGLCILGYAWIRLSHTGWAVTWLMVGIAAVLTAPGQGGLLVIATAPGGLWQLYRAVRDERPRFLRATAIVVVAVAVLALATPFGWMVAGAVRYGAGQSAVNGIANGYPWESTFGSAAAIHPWLLEVLRFSWVGAGAAAIVVTLWIFVHTPEHRFNQPLFLGISVSILCVVYVVRSAGRIDPLWPARPGWTSIWALALLLPILLTLVLRGTRQLNALAIVLTAASTLAGDYGTFGIDRVFERPFDRRSPLAAAEFVDGAQIGIPNLGVVKMDPDHVKRLVGVKRQLDRLLDPDETFLDMTNRGAQYFYFDRPPPSDLSAFYNMITADQQRRAVEGLLRHQVAVSLIDADNSLLDQVTASLRAPLVYRYLVLHFVPVSLDGYGFMLRPDRLTRAGMDEATPDEPSEKALALLDHAFLPPHLFAIPYVWGRSAGSLGKRMRDVAHLDGGQITSLVDVTPDRDGAYQVTGPKPAVALDLSAANIRGRDAGLLRFEFTCTNKRANPTFVARWSAAADTSKPGAPGPHPEIKFWVRNGVNIVPLDAAPRWLLAPTLGRVELEIIEPNGCSAFTLRDVAFAQRVEVDEMTAALSEHNSPSPSK